MGLFCSAEPHPIRLGIGGARFGFTSVYRTRFTQWCVMGLDFLDLSFAIEKRYGIGIDALDLEAVMQFRQPPDVTAGEIHFALGMRLAEMELPVPNSLWNGVRVALAQVLSVSPHEIKPGTWLIKDLGMC